MSWWNSTSHCFMQLQGLAHLFCLCHIPQRNGLLISNSFRASIQDPFSLTSFVGLFIPQGVFPLFFLIRTFPTHVIHLLICPVLGECFPWTRHVPVTGDGGGCKRGNPCAHRSSVPVGEVHSEEHYKVTCDNTYQVKKTN